MSEFWKGTPNWIRWSFIVSALGFVILLANVKGALTDLHDWMPVTYGGLEAWAQPRRAVRDQAMADLTTKLTAQLSQYEWNQIIYRSKDLGFQIEALKGQEFGLIVRVQDEPANELAKQRLDDVQRQIKMLEDERAVLTCQVENRERPAALDRC